jgi:hypothetical protein
MYPFWAGRLTVNRRQPPFSKATDKVNCKILKLDLIVNVTNKNKSNNIYMDYGGKRRESTKPKKGKRTR